MKRIAWLSTSVALFLAGPAEAQDITAEEKETSGYDGGFFLASEDGRFALKIQGRVQTRYEHLAPDGGPDESAFFLRRARLKLKGHAHSEQLKYKIQAAFDKGSVVLKDFIVDYEMLPYGVHIRAGQFKRPFSRQFITSSSKLDLIDRAITDDFFETGRDMGVAIHNNYEKSPELEWVVGIFNGTGDKSTFSGDVVVDPMTGEGEVVSGGFSNVPDRPRPAVVTRVGYNYNGIDGYAEADLEGGPLRFGVGAGAYAELDADDDDQTALRGTLDYTVKAHHLSTTGAVFASRVGAGDFSGPAQEAVGFTLQLGYVFSGRYQPTVRYAFITPEGGGDLQEARAGLAVYLYGHKVKWQTDGALLMSEIMGDFQTDLLVQSQLQFAF